MKSKVALRAIIRTLGVILTAYLLSRFLNYSAARSESNEPAGFSRGMLHGALMPMALPSLALGHDVTIYAPNNSGRIYKMGYTVGVNGCGALFFGMFFWRIRKLRGALNKYNSDTPHKPTPARQ